MHQDVRAHVVTTMSTANLALADTHTHTHAHTHFRVKLTASVDYNLQICATPGYVGMGLFFFSRPF